MTWRGEWSTLIFKLKIIHSETERNALLDDYSSVKKAKMVAFINAHAMNSVVANKSFFHALCAADDLLLDGSGMNILYRIAGRRSGLNMNGTDLIPKILSSFRGRKVAFWGTKNPYLSIAAKRCESEFGNHVVSTENGFHEIGYYVELAKKLQPELIILGMGMPKQEYLAQAIRQSGDVNSIVVCGGAVIDFISGRSPRAPNWIRSIGFEWLFRLMLEPRRLFARYVLGNPIFLYRVWAWKRSKLG
jgi:N-acetylglucosaminyldiphosphoundecaprenol N-acetyl-beta-D-mannosaminyltransferase